MMNIILHLNLSTQNYPQHYGMGARNFAFLRETDDTETETDDTVKNAICKCFGKTGFSNLHYK